MRTRIGSVLCVLAVVLGLSWADAWMQEPRATPIYDSEPFESRIIPIEEEDADHERVLMELRELRRDMELFDRDMDDIFDNLHRYQELLELEAQGKLWSA